MSVLFALAAAVGWGSSDFAAGHASRRSSAVSVVILTHFAAVVALVVVSLIPGQGGSPTLTDLGWGLAAGLGGGFGAMLLFRGLGQGSMAVVAPITATGAASIPVIAGVAQGDPITLFSVLGVSLALVAIVMVSLAGDETAEGENRDEDQDHGDIAAATATATAATTTAATTTAATTTAATTTAPAATSEANRWAAPRGIPVSTLVPRPMFRSEPPVVPANSWMPPPLQHTSILDSQRRDASPMAPAGAVALLERPPATAPVQFVPVPLAAPAPRTPPAPLAPPVATFPLAPPTALAPPSRQTPFVPPIALRSSPRHDLAPPEPGSETGGETRGETSGETGGGDSTSVSALERLRSIASRPGVVDALLSGVGFGLFFVFIARTAESAGHWPLVSARGISVVMFVAGALVARGAVLPERGSRKAVVLAGVLDAAAALLFVLSTRDGLLSVGAVLASLYPAVTIVLARVISKEQIVKRQLVGLGLAALAVSLLAI